MFLLRLRYLVPGLAVGSYYSVKNKYEEMKSQLPDFIKNMVDNRERLDSWSATIRDSSVTLNNWLDEANEALKSRRMSMNENGKSTTSQLPPTVPSIARSIETPKLAQRSETRPQITPSTLNQGNSEEILKENIGIRKELDRLRKENRELRGALRGSGSDGNNRKRKVKKSLIGIYSDVLDELSGYDSSYKVTDHLPKVVVVGDQSSGKTSVLEMIAGARIFPRGAGEMMTRAPVQVTLCDGSYHVARFKDSSREYDLSKESELADLRKEIEERMRRSVEGGKTVSNQVISLTIQGPGIQRMVLVDLPGIIGTVTNELAPDTKECIQKMVTEYMENPNAIILCIQDGSIDAERSIFTDLVQKHDSKGKRTIVVLTKVDIAEKTHTNLYKIKKILDGELFRMKALGYYAVVAGKSGKNEDIQEIKDYEEQFFLTSTLTEKGILNPNQCTTRNLSSKVSECFWGMVKSSIEQQADAYRATLLNLEAEWNYSFPHKRQLTRDELFHNARNEILNEVAKLSRLSAKHWDVFISSQLWTRVRDYIMRKVYFPASEDSLHFSARVDIELKRWVESSELPKLAIQVAKDSVKHQFDNLLDESDSNCDHKRKRNESRNDKDSDEDSIVYRDLKRAVIYDALERHEWKEQAMNRLINVQSEALSKQVTLTKENWDKSIDFLQESLRQLIDDTSKELVNLTGYSLSQQWLMWKSTTQEQHVNQMIKIELERLVQSSPEFGYNSSSGSNRLSHAKLTQTEIETVKRNLESHGLEVDDKSIERLWQPYHRYSFLLNESQRAQECRKMFYFYENDLESGTDCNHVLFFWRIKRMLDQTVNSLRGQILEDECRRIERVIVDVLDEYGDDHEKKCTLLSGKRVELAEKLKRVRQIQEKLDEFITALNSEGSS